MELLQITIFARHLIAVKQVNKYYCLFNKSKDLFLYISCTVQKVTKCKIQSITLKFIDTQVRNVRQITVVVCSIPQGSALRPLLYTKIHL